MTSRHKLKILFYMKFCVCPDTQFYHFTNVNVFDCTYVITNSENLSILGAVFVYSTIGIAT